MKTSKMRSLILNKLNSYDNIVDISKKCKNRIIDAIMGTIDKNMLRIYVSEPRRIGFKFQESRVVDESYALSGLLVITLYDDDVASAVVHCSYDYYILIVVIVDGKNAKLKEGILYNDYVKSRDAQKRI